MEEFPEFTGAYFGYEVNSDQNDQAYRKIGGQNNFKRWDWIIIHQ
jgi:hypothetical protein